MSDTEAILRWLVALSLVSLAVAPLTWWLGDGLARARYGLTRPLGVILVTALLWWPAALLGIPFTQLTLVLVTAIVGMTCWAWWWLRSRDIDVRALGVFELLWIVLFLAYALFRSYHPDIANTEKPMEIALLSSVSRSGDVPAPDPWFAGETINYYYFGYQVIGSLVKLSGVPPAIAFNLGLATLFASLGTAAAATGYRLARAFGLQHARSALAGALAIFFLLLAGNLESMIRLVRDPGDTLASGWWYDDVGWQASRVIVDRGVHGSPDPAQTINEFPAFAFVLGDLHPHVLTYPLLLSIATIVIGLVCVPKTITRTRVAAIGSLIGLLYVSNSWDAPLGLLLLTGALGVGLGWRRRETWKNVGLAGVCALLTAAPFLMDFAAPVGVQTSELPDVVRSIPLVSNILSTLGVVTWRPSSTAELLTVHGHWIAAFALFALYGLSTNKQIRGALRNRFDLLVALLLFALAIAVVWAPAVILIGIPLTMAVAITTVDQRPAIRAIAGLFAAGFFLTFIPEFIYIQDAFGNRMNTVFKLYFQAWLMFSIATAAGLSIVLSRGSSRIRSLLAAITVALILSVAPYTPISVRDWTADFDERSGLNGAEYIAQIAPDEAAAIEWLRTNAPDGAVIVEGPGCSYGSVSGIPMNRMSAFSGVPAIVGWAGHEVQWRRGEDEPIGPRVNHRQSVANRWLAGESATAPNLPDPDFIVLGRLEASGSEDCESLMAHDVQEAADALRAAGWQSVFTSEDVVILAKNMPDSAGILD